MSQFFLRIANYLANELIVKGLANNRAFQRFALRTADHVDKLKTTGVEHSDKVRGGCMSLWGTVRVLVWCTHCARLSTHSPNMNASITRQVAKEMEKHVGLAGRFMDALKAEVKKDMDKFAKK